MGGHAPIDDDLNSSNVFYNFHVNHAFRLDDEAVRFVVPFIELSGIRYASSGNGSRKGGAANAQLGLAPYEGVDVANLGTNGISGANLVTMAWGVRLPLAHGLSFGASYERPLSKRKDLWEQRVTAMLTWEL